MASFYIPLTGLESDSTALNTIANDLANLNTTGFKAQTANFADIFYNEIGENGAGNLLQVGSGVQVGSIESSFTAGTPTATGNDANVALTGNGFFVLNDGGTNLLTRDGDFTIAPNGDLTTQSGLSVMGYPATNGVVNTGAPLVGINIPQDGVQSAQATSSFGVTANLDSTAAVNSTATSQLQAYDSLGEPQEITVTYTKTANNTWTYSIALPAGAAAGSANTTGTLTFDTSGNLLTPASNVAGISFTGLTDGSADMTLNWNVLGSTGNPTITQTDQASGTPASTQNGNPAGEYQSYTIASDGTVLATYSNGNQQAIGQLALGNVANLQGLQLLGNGEYGLTRSSGPAAIGISGSNGLGAMEDANLEASNVNISAEFSDLIIAQRAFEANSKSVTTFDTVAQETINMVH
jgi:flagellar hook protein FlgE